MFKSIISAEVNTVWNEPQSNHEVIAGGAEVYIVYCNEFSHVVSYPYGTYLSTNNKIRDLSYVTLQWELWNFKNKSWHGVIVLFPRLNNCKFSENRYFNFFQMAEKFCQVRKSIFCTFGKRRVGKKLQFGKANHIQTWDGIISRNCWWRIFSIFFLFVKHTVPSIS